jgi:hypothetical protein
MLVVRRSDDILEGLEQVHSYVPLQISTLLGGTSYLRISSTNRHLEDCSFSHVLILFDTTKGWMMYARAL